LKNFELWRGFNWAKSGRSVEGNEIEEHWRFRESVMSQEVWSCESPVTILYVHDDLPLVEWWTSKSGTGSLNWQKQHACSVWQLECMARYDRSSQCCSFQPIESDPAPFGLGRLHCTVCVYEDCLRSGRVRHWSVIVSCVPFSTPTISEILFCFCFLKNKVATSKIYNINFGGYYLTRINWRLSWSKFFFIIGLMFKFYNCFFFLSYY
jgi:hypothetical protein